MGPNSMKMLEKILKSVKLEKGMRVLDLGCGKGLINITIHTTNDKMFSKGHLSKLLRNKVYIGKIEHKENILPPDFW